MDGAGLNTDLKLKPGRADSDGPVGCEAGSRTDPNTDYKEESSP